MTRRIICAILRFTLRIFFRRIEIAGLERVPPNGALIFVLNHPNGLVDPVFLLSLAPRPVSFLAKAPLFRMPVISYLVRAMDSLPVYRHQDEGSDVSRNRETFARAHDLLMRGGTIGICPEGVSHNEPRLRPLKTGAARIALGAAAAGSAIELKIIPAGLYYTSKTSFRSSALLYFGEPIEVEPVGLDAQGEPPREAVRALSDKIETALRDVVLDAEHTEALNTVERAERIFSSADDNPPVPQTLERELKLRRRFVEGYSLLRARQPERLAALDARIRRYEEELRQARLDVDELSAPPSPGVIIRYLLTRTILFALLLPPALAGLVIHYPTYHLAGFLATRLSQKQDDVVSTFKIIAALLLFPLTWIVIALVAWRFAGLWAGFLSLLLAPLTGYAALRFFEGLDEFVGGARALLYFITRRRFFIKLMAERRRIRDEILELGDEAAREAS